MIPSPDGVRSAGPLPQASGSLADPAQQRHPAGCCTSGRILAESQILDTTVAAECPHMCEQCNRNFSTRLWLRNALTCASSALCLSVSYRRDTRGGPDECDGTFEQA